jgi:hypothetical protein
MPRSKKLNMPANGWPKITQGSHLTVVEHENGRRELIWDDEALMRDVRNAIENHELSQLKPAVKAKSATRKKKNVE